jgi:hypothetical protein
VIATAASHLDHALPREVVDYLLAHFVDRSAFFIESIDLSAHLPSVECGLHGPVMGDASVPDAECSSEVRGDRGGPSRLCARPLRPCRVVTVIAGPHGGHPCVLYTVFGGPSAPREPWDPSLSDAERAESVAFWSEHALSR